MSHPDAPPRCFKTEILTWDLVGYALKTLKLRKQSGGPQIRVWGPHRVLKESEFIEHFKTRRSYILKSGFSAALKKTENLITPEQKLNLKIVFCKIGLKNGLGP